MYYKLCFPHNLSRPLFRVACVLLVVRLFIHYKCLWNHNRFKQLKYNVLWFDTFTQYMAFEIEELNGYRRYKIYIYAGYTMFNLMVALHSKILVLLKTSLSINIKIHDVCVHSIYLVFLLGKKRHLANKSMADCIYYTFVHIICVLLILCYFVMQ